jgi:hypothetical protein
LNKNNYLIKLYEKSCEVIELEEYLTYKENASRIELIVRIFYTLVLVIVSYFYALLTGLCMCIQWIVILILGRRIEDINGIITGYVKYRIQYISYVYLITDERPGIGPKYLDVYINDLQYLLYEENASRIELIVRIFYKLVLRIVFFLYGILASICLCIQWIIILILGRRIESINGILSGYAKYTIQIISYSTYITDERPGIDPKQFDVYLEMLKY